MNCNIGYYGDKLSKNEPIIITGDKPNKKTIKKIDGAKLDPTKNIKFEIYAYKLVNGKKVRLGKSLTMYIAGKNNGKYSNVEEVTLNKKSVSLEKGGKFAIKAGYKLADASKKMIKSSTAKFRYISADETVAKVDSKGNITAVGKGKCYVYIYSRSGAYARIKVTVK